MQVTAPVRSAPLMCFIIYPSCCTGLQEVLLGFCCLWHHESLKLDEMKVWSIGTAAHYGKLFLQRFECVIRNNFRLNMQQYVSSP